MAKDTKETQPDKVPQTGQKQKPRWKIYHERVNGQAGIIDQAVWDRLLARFPEAEPWQTGADTKRNLAHVYLKMPYEHYEQVIAYEAALEKVKLDAEVRARQLKRQEELKAQLEKAEKERAELRAQLAA